MRGKVLFYIGHPDKPELFYGFIVPEGCTQREANYWFGPKCLNGLKGYAPKSGDNVEFDAGNFRPGKGPCAARITRVLATTDEGEEITTLEGDEYVY